jgi:anti-sigma B factor antagonist
VNGTGESKPLLGIGFSRTGDSFVISLVGELDVSTAPTLHADLLRLIDDGVAEVICDLDLLRYVDSTGLSVLLMAHKRLESQGGALILRDPQPNVRRLFELTGVDALVTIRTALDEGKSIPK